MRDKSLEIATYQRDKIELHKYKTGVLALEQMQQTAANKQDVERWLFLQKRIEEFEFKIEFIKEMQSKFRIRVHTKANRDKIVL